MDGDRFDALTRLLGRDATRRGAATMATILAGAGLAGLYPGPIDAKRKKKKKKCKPKCISPQSKCTTKCQNCCSDSQGNLRFCELVPVCPDSADGKYCCGKEGTECTQDCDCCGDLVCPDGACCVSFGTACTDQTACCGDCESGTCCSNTGGECEEDVDCCGALTCVGENPGVSLGSCQPG
jgi:hypothetical protein